MFRKLKNIYHLLQAITANVWYGFPGKNLICIGITGTDGKSTTTNLIYHILRTAGEKAGIISTVGCKINDEDFSIGLHTTTPDVFTMQKLLTEMRKRTCKYAVIEVASHGIDQKRIWGINFKIAVLTNITHEHLDYHGSLAEYEKIKLSFLKTAKIALINAKYKKDNFKSSNIVFAYGVGIGNYKAVNIERGKFTLLAPDNSYEINHELLGTFNVENILAAFSACSLVGISSDKIIKAISSFRGVRGRLEIIENNNNLNVYVDFAHTPNAIEQILITLRQEFPNSRIIHVFGATGKRDNEKRPIMGKISGKLADISVLTTEDTYGENPLRIVSMIENGIKQTDKILNETYYIQPERKKALELAVKIARANDVIVATGVGHQTTLNVGREIKWNDQNALRKILSSANQY